VTAAGGEEEERCEETENEVDEKEKKMGEIKRDMALTPGLQHEGVGFCKDECDVHTDEGGL
jgi:hypothetical protein